MARTAASESRSDQSASPTKGRGGGPAATSTPTILRPSTLTIRRPHSAGPKYKVPRQGLKKTPTPGKRRRQSEESKAGEKKAKTMADQDLFTKMTTYMDGKFATSDAKVDDISNKVGVLSASVTNLTGQVNKNVAEINRLQVQVNAIRAAPQYGVRKQVKKILEELGPDGNKNDVERLSCEVEKLKAERATGGRMDRP